MGSNLRRVVVLGASALLIGGCGGDEERQDADEPRGTFEVEISDAQFATRQRLARQEEFVLSVRNSGSQRVPNVAATVDGFTARSSQPGLSDPERPVWIVDEGPEGGGTAYTNTWALGPIEPGATKTFRWKLTPVRAGSHTVRYKVAAGLDGRARAVAATGGEPLGTIQVRVSDNPPKSRVNPRTGEVERPSDD